MDAAVGRGQGGWLLVGTGFWRGTGAYTLDHPPEQFLGGWGAAGSCLAGCESPLSGEIARRWKSQSL